MSVICPVTNKQCPYLKKLDTDICPREHECDAVKESYSGMIQKPPMPKKFFIILFSVLIMAIIGVSLVYFLVLDGDLSFFSPGRYSNKNISPSGSSITAVPSETATENPSYTPVPTLSSSYTPFPVITPEPTQLPPVPITSEAATMPVRIELNGALAEIKGVPLDNNQKIDVLPSSLTVSWYEGSYIPGETGNCILFGYKHYNGMAGIFYNLDSLSIGDTIKFTLDNGTVIEQTVIKTTIYRNGYLPAEILSLDSDSSRTTLISETGDIDSKTGTYNDLIVILTE